MVLVACEDVSTFRPQAGQSARRASLVDKSTDSGGIDGSSLAFDIARGRATETIGAVPRRSSHSFLGRPDNMFSTSTILLIVAVSAVEIALGVTLGWWMRGGRERRHLQQQAQVQRAIGKIQQLTSDVAGDVGRHQSQMSSINQELALWGAPSKESLQSKVDEIVEVNNHLRQKLRKAEDKLQEQAQVIQTVQQANRTDALTGVANRRAFNDDLQQNLQAAKEQTAPLSLLLIDVDRFKQVNDKHGHQAGDQVLQRVAAALVSALPDAQLVARYGGEEFAAILPGATLAEARQAAEKARQAVESQVIDLGIQKLKVTISSGLVAALPEDDVDTFLRRADTALYASKEAGRNCTHAHDGQQLLRVGGGESADARRPVVSQVPQRAAEHVSSDARIDGLTGLPNRRAFSEQLRTEIGQSTAADDLSLLLLDVDQLEKINQRFGHTLGDVMLRAVSQILRTATTSGTFAARFEGATFAVLLAGAGIETAVLIAERLRMAMSLCRLRAGANELRFTVSTGVSAALPGDDSVALIKRATTALLISKRAGGDTSHTFDGRNCAQVSAELLSS